MSDARAELIDILNQSGPNYDHDAAVDVDAILAHPDVVLRALGADAVLDWLETADGFGFVVEYLRHVAAQ